VNARRAGLVRFSILGAALSLAAGCATTAPPPPPEPLARADQEMAAARYRDAVRLYEEFIVANPGHPAAMRARAAQSALDRLIAAQAEIERLRTDLGAREAEVARLRQDLAARTTDSQNRSAEVTRLRRDLDSRQAEVDRLKADLERLRSIDLRKEPARR
jgi:septal ring factor EnvC (AmiA/AmiB activator)